METWDFVIIGSGVGGAGIARSLAGTGARVLVLERGGWLPREPDNWDVRAVFNGRKYKTQERWESASGRSFLPDAHYWVGGNSKVFGGVLLRLRERDFGEMQYEAGLSPAWPIAYSDLAPWYDQAERLYGAHGIRGEDPTDPPGPDYPFPAIPHEPCIERLAAHLTAEGLHPFHAPLGVDVRPDGTCIRCRTCDGFPCPIRAKYDAEVAVLRPALAMGGVEMWVHAFARRLLMEPGGRRVRGVEVERDGSVVEVGAATVVVSCGAGNSAALLLRSANADHPLGVANGSGQVGRNYLAHNNAAVMAVDPLRRNPVFFQKTLAINDFYLGDGGAGNSGAICGPAGAIQLIGKAQAGILASAKPWVPRPALSFLAQHSVDWWVMSEDLPNPDNRVTVTGAGRIRLHWQPRNTSLHRKLIRTLGSLMRRIGYRIVLVQPMGIETTGSQMGTLRFGTDPASSVLDPWCRAHEVHNLYVVDASFFPSAGAVNPALTIAAQALRVGAHLRDEAAAATSSAVRAESAAAVKKPSR